MATLKNYNVLEVPTGSSPDGQYFVKKDSGNEIWIVSKGVAVCMTTNKTVFTNGVGGGTAQAQTITVTGDVKLVTGLKLTYIPSVSNTASTPTININGTGAKTIINGAHTAINTNIMSGDIIVGTPAELIYDGTNFRLLNPQTIVQNKIVQLETDLNVEKSKSIALDFYAGPNLFNHNYSLELLPKIYYSSDGTNGSGKSVYYNFGTKKYKAKLGDVIYVSGLTIYVSVYAVIFTNDSDVNGSQRITAQYTSNYAYFTMPSDGYFIIFTSYDHLAGLVNTVHYSSSELINAALSSKLQIEKNIYTDYSIYGDGLPIRDVKKAIEEIDVKTLFSYDSKNKINPSKIKYDRRYSASTKQIVKADANLIALSDLIHVTEGEWYAVSGDGIYSGYQGGYFAENATTNVGQTAIDNITFSIPVNGIGRCFKVPFDLGIKYVIISLACNSAKTALAGNAQMELGEMATDYSAYSPVKYINPELIQNNSAAISNSEAQQWYTSIFGIHYSNIDDKIINFKNHWLSKDKDLVVVNTGTSLTARSSEHCTLKDNPTERPPLLHSNNLASHIWDKIKWEGQKYRRYDYAGFFTETGTFQTQSNIADWDDGSYRDGLTRYSDGNASSIGFVIPINAWQFNFIYRSDINCTENATVIVAEGNNKLQVWDGTSWVEANGFIFSQKETPETYISNVSYTSPIDGTVKLISNFKTKGNTTYQKRLKFRCKGNFGDSRSISKNVTLSTTSGRLSYWGVEWSNREYMITYINAARGSHNMTMDSGLNLLHYQDNEIWSFKPDLICTENPIHNSGGGNVPSSLHPSTYWGVITNNFFFDSNIASLLSRATALGVTNLEWVIFNSSITYNFGAIDANGELIIAQNADNRMITALDAQSMAYQYLKDNHENVIAINCCKNWVEAGVKIFGDLKTATLRSGKSGDTFTNEGSHWNDTGSKVQAKMILPIFDFIE